MSYFLLLVKNRMTINLNKFLYVQKESKNDKSGFFVLMGGLIFFSLLIILLSLGLSTIGIKFSQELFLTDVFTQKVEWFSIWFLIMFLIIAFDNLLNQYHDFSKTNEFKLVLTSPIDVHQFLLAKLAEPYLTKLFVGVLIAVPVLWNIAMKFQLSVFGITLLAIILIIFIFISVITRSLLMMLMINLKSRNMNLSYFVLLNTGVYYLIVSLFLISLKPFKSMFPVFIKDIIATISFLFPLYLIDDLQVGSFSPFKGFVLVLEDILTKNFTMGTIVIVSVIIASFIIITTFFVEQSRRMKRAKTVEMFFENIHIHQPAAKRRNNIHGASFLQINNVNNLLLVKDLKLLTRENKSYWIASIFTIVAGYGTLVAGYYIASSQMTIPDYEQYIGIVLCIFANSLVANSLIDKYGFDAEGKPFHLLLLAPIKHRQLIWSKFYFLIIMSLPFWVLFTLVTSYLFNVNIVVILLLLISSTFAYGMICLFSSMVFPDFNHEDITQIPTMKSKLLSNGLSTGYFAILSMILYVIPGYSLGILSTLLASVLVGALMLYLTLIKLDEYTIS
ncbi:hypothetical protein QTG56_07360 [Rossellomorea sp. AcN35-11]|nr:hypothetical protein [Rossellomorea aquimaris]WJV30832.1 hypothetical protein QTG56_07360 [Rossellomorea sp. AcN35-11]